MRKSTKVSKIKKIKHLMAFTTIFKKLGSSQNKITKTSNQKIPKSIERRKSIKSNSTKKAKPTILSFDKSKENKSFFEKNKTENFKLLK
jgi:hypothetical protein